MLKSWNFFSDLKRKGEYIAYRKLVRGSFTPQQVHHTVARIKYKQKVRRLKIYATLAVVLLVLLIILVVLNQRVLF